jgi:hypothetical protein
MTSCLPFAQSELRDARDETRKLRDEFKAFKGALSGGASAWLHPCFVADASACVRQPLLASSWS